MVFKPFTLSQLYSSTEKAAYILPLELSRKIKHHSRKFQNLLETLAVSVLSQFLSG